MKKISPDIIFENPPHVAILDQLIKHHYGLSFHDLHYLLIKHDDMKKISKLQIRFGLDRNNIFKTRQRLNDCLKDLISIELVKKEGDIYKIDYFEMNLLLETKNTEIKFSRFAKKLRRDHYNRIKEYENDEIKKLSEKITWGLYGKKLKRKYSIVRKFFNKK